MRTKDEDEKERVETILLDEEFEAGTVHAVTLRGEQYAASTVCGIWLERRVWDLARHFTVHVTPCAACLDECGPASSASGAKPFRFTKHS